jgi:hypothetical protein
VITDLAWRPSRDAATTPYSEQGAVGCVRWPTAPRFNANQPVSSAAITSSSKKASSTSQPRRLNHTQLLITFAYHRVRRILLHLRASYRPAVKRGLPAWG